MKLLEKVALNIKVIYSKKNILAKFMGFIFEITKVTDEDLDPT